jgi:hypothetical protein
MNKLLFIGCTFLALLSSINLEASKIKFRAREHYEVHKININGASSTYKGFSNSLNIWYEKPYDFSYGLVISPIAPSKFKSTDLNPVAGKKIFVLNLGVEAKYFPHIVLDKLYLRGGAGYSFIDTKNKKDLSGKDRKN